MVTRRRLAGLLAALLASPTLAAAPIAPPGSVKVRIETELGPILIAVDRRRAPITSANFLRYVDAHRFDGTYFYRAARSTSHPGEGLVQGGIDTDYRRSFAPIAHEPTSRTGLKHVDGTVSMARNGVGTAMGNFFFVVGTAPNLDAAPNYPGYAAFGRVLAGMPLIKRILASPTYPGGYSKDMMGQTIVKRIRIVSTSRVP